MLRVATITILVTSLFFGSAVAGRMEKLVEKIEPEGAREVKINLDFGAGEIRLTPDDISEVAIIEIEYDPRRVTYDVAYSTRGNSGTLDLESRHRSSRNIDTERNIWDLTISTRYVVELSLNLGACDAEMDLGGIPITDLSLDIGAAAGEIDFSSPNPERLRTIDIDAGAASLEMSMIGNANFDEMNFSGGAGSFELDFRGDYNGESVVSIDVGLGSGDIILPRGVPCQVETDGDGWFSSIDFHNDDLEQVADDLYETEDFERAKTRIIVDVEVGMGSVDLYWK